MILLFLPLCILFAPLLIASHQNDGLSYVNVKYSLLKICEIIMHKHHYFHFINGQIRENWTLQYFKVET